MAINDTIVAVSTPLGPGGIGIVRLSGKHALAIAQTILEPDRPLKDLPTHTVSYRKLLDPATATLFDEALVTVMRAPRSYTREDVVEISCHSGLPTIKMLLALLVAGGARQAEPGEFTRRAFLSGRIDLTQAQAVMSLVQAQSEASAKAAARQAGGYLAVEVSTIREQLIMMAAHLEAAVDFSDEDIDTRPLALVDQEIADVIGRIEDLQSRAARGAIFDAGLVTAIIGSPNVGKSSLLNALAMSERAIVSPRPGTTRDIVEAKVSLAEVPLILQDTAGWREAGGDIEVEGIARGREARETADLTLLVLDGSRALGSEDKGLIESLSLDNQTIVVINKNDLAQELEPASLPAKLSGSPTVRVSALRRIGLDELAQEVYKLFGLGVEPGGSEMIIVAAQQKADLESGRARLVEAADAICAGHGEEIVSMLVKESADSLGRLTGAILDEEILDAIFETFCVGK